MKNIQILVLGPGFLGQRISDFFGCPLSGERINSYGQVEMLIQKYRPKVLINAIGFVGRDNVDGCEHDIDKTLKSNALVPLLLAEAALRHGLKLVHISSGCIFHFDYKSQKAIAEDYPPDYYDLYYSRTKIYADNALLGLEKHGNILTLRVRIPLDDRPHPKNILTKLLGFQAVIDNPNSITYVPDFLLALKHLIRIDARGVYNVVLKGKAYYTHLLDEYQRRKPGFSYRRMPLKDLKLTRTNLVLSARKLEKSGFKVRTPKQIYRECVQRYLDSESGRRIS